MTIILKNVEEKFLPKVEEFSKSINAQYESKNDESNNQKYIEETIKDFLLPENYAIFERLKDK